jgi:hypothetical protein
MNPSVEEEEDIAAFADFVTWDGSCRTSFRNVIIASRTGYFWHLFPDQSQTARKRFEPLLRSNASKIAPGKTLEPNGAPSGATIERIRLLGGGGASGLGAGAGDQPKQFVLNPERLGYQG